MWSRLLPGMTDSCKSCYLAPRKPIATSLEPVEQYGSLIIAFTLDFVPVRLTFLEDCAEKCCYLHSTEIACLLMGVM